MFCDATRMRPRQYLRGVVTAQAVPSAAKHAHVERRQSTRRFSGRPHGVAYRQPPRWRAWKETPRLSVSHAPSSQQQHLRASEPGVLDFGSGRGGGVRRMRHSSRCQGRTHLDQWAKAAPNGGSFPPFAPEPTFGLARSRAHFSPSGVAVLNRATYKNKRHSLYAVGITKTCLDLSHEPGELRMCRASIMREGVTHVRKHVCFVRTNVSNMSADCC